MHFPDSCSVVTTLAKMVDENGRLFIVVRRGSPLNRVLSIWNREMKKNIASTHPVVRVHFGGEEGIDSGAMAKEFFTLTLPSIGSVMFPGGKPLDSTFHVQGPVSRKSRKLSGPEKPFVKLRSAYSVKLVFSYVVKGIKIKITAKFRASRRLVLKIQRELCHPKCARKVSGLSRNRPQAPVPEKTISANRGLNPANRGIKFVLRLDCVPQNTISTIPGIK